MQTRKFHGFFMFVTEGGDGLSLQTVYKIIEIIREYFNRTAMWIF